MEYLKKINLPSNPNLVALNTAADAMTVVFPDSNFKEFAFKINRQTPKSAKTPGRYKFWNRHIALNRSEQAPSNVARDDHWAG